jgi:Recombination protein MgsA
MDSENDFFNDKTELSSPEEGAVPLALRMRPASLDEFVGQKHILGQGKLLRRLIDSDRLGSLILYGPSGTGKSALASVISRLTRSVFVSMHAASAGVKEVKAELQAAQKRKQATGKRTILFVDEIHRFNKSQQDVLINDMELGTIILIGATTHNPFFYVIPALLSRSQVFELKPHTPEDLLSILRAALTDKVRGLGGLPIDADDEALRHLCRSSDGDARRCLNALEVGILSTPPGPDNRIHFTEEVSQESIQEKDCAL